MSNSLNISIVIPNWNGLSILKESLDSVMAAVSNYSGDSEVIIVDNGSSDRSLDVLADFYPQVITIALDKNYGFGYACNIGAEKSKYKHIFFLNNDIKLPRDFFNILSSEYSQLENPFSISPQTNYWSGNECTDMAFSTAIYGTLKGGDFIQKWGVENGKNNLPPLKKTFYGTGAALLVDADKFNEIGGFEDIYNPAYWEDVDLCLNAWRRGWPSYYTSKTIAWHKVSATSNKQGSSFKERLSLKNYFIFYLINVSKFKDLISFMVLATIFSIMELALLRKNTGLTFFITLFTKSKEIFAIRKERKKHYINELAQVENATLIESNGWTSPKRLDLNFFKKIGAIYANYKIERAKI